MSIELTISSRLLAPSEIDERCRRLVDFWHRLRGARVAPRRKDVDPLEIKSWLGWLHLWERLDDGDFRCRLWGTEITQSSGSIRDGQRVSEMWPQDYGKTLAGHYRAAMMRAEPQVYRIRFVHPEAEWVYDRAVLPLVPGDGARPMLLNYTLLDRTATAAFWDRVRASADGTLPGWRKDH